MTSNIKTSITGYFKRYSDLVPEDELSIAFANQAEGIQSFLNNISEEKSGYAYAEGKWTIKELLQHVIDTERIFCYRALCFARGEKANLPGFEEDDYANNSHANNRTWQSLIDEFLTVRKSTQHLFGSFSDEILSNIGKANNNEISVGAIGFVTIGHYYHHKNILIERYLK